MENIMYICRRWSDYFLLIVALLTTVSCEKENDSFAFDEEINVAIKELKEFYKGEDLMLNGKQHFKKIFITGIVVSAASSGNLPIEKGIVIQEERIGINVMLDDNASFKLGDSVRVNIEAGTLTAVHKNITVTGIKSSDVEVLKENASIVPRTAVIAELNANFAEYAGSLVKVVGAEILGHQANDTFQGDKELDDGTGGTIHLHTNSSASFANKEVPSFGTFTGIVQYGLNGSAIQLWMRDDTDLEEYNPSPYPAGFPEVFNTSLVKDAYARANLDLASGNWTFDGVTLVTKTDLRPINVDGTKGVQFNQRNEVPLYLQMNFDVYRGASKVTILHGSYGTDPGCTWRLESSTDGGVTWSQVGNDVVANNKTPEIAEFDLDIKGQVRFRIHKLGLGADNNGRLNMDDFTIYNN
ncbi:MAG TPA: DUF5689 domain-containing protein [Sphingobacterium sp.]|jgi:hypothetical protein|nr:DUF5689 domain-containing protein [Sphingobacterium sp.]